MAELTIAEFISARLDAEEQQARSVPGPRWKRGAILFDSGNVCEEYIAVDEPNRREVVLSDVDGMVIPFVVTWDPARVLAEVEAKRRILARHSAAPGGEALAMPPYCAAHAYRHRDGMVTYPVQLDDCPELRDLAAIWGGHAEYRAEWAPVARRG